MSGNKYIKIIATVANNGVIADNREIPWDANLKITEEFLDYTKNSIVVMGNHTFQDRGPILVNRKNWVVTSNVKNKRRTKGIKYFDNPEKVITTNPRTNKWVIGGADMFRYFMFVANEMILFYLKKDYEGDLHFPVIYEDVWDIKILEDNPDFKKVLYKRK